MKQGPAAVNFPFMYLFIQEAISPRWEENETQPCSLELRPSWVGHPDVEKQQYHV